MLRSAIISPDRTISAELRRALDQVGGTYLIRTIEEYPSVIDLTRFLRAHAPQVIFVSVECMAEVTGILAQIEECSPGVQVVAIHGGYDPSLLLEVMRSGIREFIALPFDRAQLADVLERTSHALHRRPVQCDSTELVYAFLPSKAGVGTSTIALNTAVALSRAASGRTLLTDFDLNSGMIRFMLKLENQYSVVDAAKRSLDLDEKIWPQLVTESGNLDVLHAGKLNPNFRMEQGQVRGVVDFVRRNYKVVCIDLSGNLEKYSIELMHEAKRVFLVCTPEIPSLHLARDKYEYLQGMDLGGRVSLLVNRCHKKNVLSPAEIQDLVGVPVQLTFPNDYHCVHRALAEGRPIEPTAEFGKQCHTLGQMLLDQKPVVNLEKKRFIEFFSIAAPRYSFESRKSSA